MCLKDTSGGRACTLYNTGVTVSDVQMIVCAGIQQKSIFWHWFTSAYMGFSVVCVLNSIKGCGALGCKKRLWKITKQLDNEAAQQGTENHADMWKNSEFILTMNSFFCSINSPVTRIIVWYLLIEDLFNCKAMK